MSSQGVRAEEDVRFRQTAFYRNNEEYEPYVYQRAVPASFEAQQDLEHLASYETELQSDLSPCQKHDRNVPTLLL